MSLTIRSNSYPDKNPPKIERLEVRVNSEQKKLFQHAADLLGGTFSDFIANTLQKASLRIIKQYEILSLAAEDREVFIQALLDPSKPNQRLQRAKQRYEKEFGNK